MLTPLPARRPLALALGLTAGLLLSLIVAGAAVQLLRLPLPTPVPLAFVPVALALGVWAGRHRQWRDLGYRWPAGSPGARRALVTTTAAIVTVLAVQAWSIGAWNLPVLPAWLAVTALVAFVEETFFRGIVLRLLLPAGWTRAWVVSALVFGLGHAANLAGGQSLGETVLQIGFALCWGLFTAAAYARTGSLWPALVFHALFDGSELAGVHPSTLPADLAALVVLLVAGLGLGLGVPDAGRRAGAGRRPRAGRTVRARALASG